LSDSACLPQQFTTVYFDETRILYIYLFVTVFDGDTRPKMLQKMATTPFALRNLSQLNTGPDDKLVFELPNNKVKKTNNKQQIIL
jgi:hypothetical protein